MSRDHSSRDKKHNIDIHGFDVSHKEEIQGEEKIYGEIQGYTNRNWGFGNNIEYVWETFVETRWNRCTSGYIRNSCFGNWIISG